jgi:preprotein translocase subunit SecE
VARPVAKKDNSVVKPENAVQRFVRETRAELLKVVWPTREEAVRLTTVVVVVIAAMSIFLGAIDYIFNLVTQFLLR